MRDKESAQMICDILREDEDTAPASDSADMKMIATDLQQTLPCLSLRAEIAYYKRKLWMYNLCFYDINKQETTMFVWNEVTGGRGSNEEATRLLKWLQLKICDEHKNFTALRICRDKCGERRKKTFSCSTS